MKLNYNTLQILINLTQDSANWICLDRFDISFFHYTVYGIFNIWNLDGHCTTKTKFSISKYCEYQKPSVIDVKNILSRQKRF